jgi:hypothetical protein
MLAPTPRCWRPQGESQPRCVDGKKAHSLASLIGDDDDPVIDAHLGPATRRVAGIVEQEAALAQVAHRGNSWQCGKLL